MHGAEYAMSRCPVARERGVDDPALAERHQPFVAALAGAPPGQPRWLGYQAGLLTLALAHRAWSKRRAIAVGERRLLVAHGAIRAVRRPVVRKALNNIVDTVAPGGTSPRSVLDAFGPYAKCLSADGEFRLALHVSHLIIGVATREGLFDLLPAAYEHAGSCLREQGEMAGAFGMYDKGHVIATQLGDVPAELRIALARANVLRGIGRLVEARHILDTVLRRAKELSSAEIVGRAAQERGIVARRFADYIDAIGYYAQAYHAFTNERDRFRLLNDIALSLAYLGHRSDARSLWVAVSLVAKGERSARWKARINLMMLAQENGAPVAFDQSAESLKRTPMPAPLLVEYLLEYGEGCARFGRPDESIEAYKRAARIAKERGWTRQYQTALDALSGRPPQAAPKSDVPLELPSKVTELVVVLRERYSLRGLLGRSYGGDVNTPPVRTLRTVLRRGRPPKLDVR
jgi:tetratricopeptide (TPR) repeat protein